MTQIKSAKAYNHIYERFCYKTDEVYGLDYWDGFTEISQYELLRMLYEFRDVAIAATKIAETEAEELHAKELRELKERVVKAFCFCGICKNISSQVEESESCPFIIECDDRKLFIEKLNEK